MVCFVSFLQNTHPNISHHLHDTRSPSSDICPIDTIKRFLSHSACFKKTCLRLNGWAVSLFYDSYFTSIRVLSKSLIDNWLQCDIWNSLWSNVYAGWWLNSNVLWRILKKKYLFEIFCSFLHWKVLRHWVECLGQDNCLRIFL